MNTLDIVLRLLPVITGFIGFSIQGFIKEKENKKLRDQLQEQNERIKANEMYEKIRNKRELFEDTLADLLCLDSECSINERKRSFFKIIQKYTALYNEIEDFCTKLFDGAINSESYIKETVLPILNELAENQIETFKLLNEYAIKYDLEKLKKPDYKAFDNYDKFLITYNGGESSYFWRKLKNNRRNNGFE